MPGWSRGGDHGGRQLLISPPSPRSLPSALACQARCPPRSVQVGKRGLPGDKQKGQSLFQGPLGNQRLRVLKSPHPPEEVSGLTAALEQLCPSDLCPQVSQLVSEGPKPAWSPPEPLPCGAPCRALLSFSVTAGGALSWLPGPPAPSTPSQPASRPLSRSAHGQHPLPPARAWGSGKGHRVCWACWELPPSQDPPRCQRPAIFPGAPPPACPLGLGDAEPRPSSGKGPPWWWRGGCPQRLLSWWVTLQEWACPPHGLGRDRGGVAAGEGEGCAPRSPT